MGQPTKLTPERRDKILQYLRQGAFTADAARAAGVSPQAVYEWLARGEGKDPRGRKVTPLYARFADAVREAEAAARIAGELEIIRMGRASGDWRARAWLLERKHPGLYARMERREHTGPDGAPLISQAGDDLLRRILADPALTAAAQELALAATAPAAATNGHGAPPPPASTNGHP